jgi:predicted SAM-dependent methyltransferase
MEELGGAITDVREQQKSDRESISAMLDGEIERISTDINMKMNANLSDTHQRIDGVESRLGGVESRLGGAESRLGGVESRLGGVEAGVSYVTARVEFVRTETMYEVMYGRGKTPKAKTEPKVLNLTKLQSMSGAIRLNVGCGHIPMDGYLNVDRRELPGVDVVAEAAEMPFEPGSVCELFSSHLIEHFPQEEFKRVVVPYWHALLQDGGVLRAVMPDSETMIRKNAEGEYPFEKLRLVTFGAQDYDGDFHFNMFSRETLNNILAEAGFRNIAFPVVGRINGDCYEMEVSAVK